MCLQRFEKRIKQKVERINKQSYIYVYIKIHL
uniref:Uncharacterized protein n=1 Tax=Myoviridae sp. ctYA416 TaxID=2825125 RepID=A0A8S5UTY2_9CAUD|nr:MAG TPA: hypothetical protein [Myoviridae sp. ctYA416]